MEGFKMNMEKNITLECNVEIIVVVDVYKMFANIHFVSEDQRISDRCKDIIVAERNVFLLLIGELRVCSGHYDVTLPDEEE
jgi:hypothetical protein